MLRGDLESAVGVVCIGDCVLVTRFCDCVFRGGEAASRCADQDEGCEAAPSGTCSFVSNYRGFINRDCSTLSCQ